MEDKQNQVFGDGKDSYAGAVNKVKNAVKALKKVAKAGKAAGEIAAGTASGGPVGAIIGAAWSMRHTLFKVLVCVCIVVLFIVITIAAIPQMLFDNIENTFNSEVSLSAAEASLDDLSGVVTDNLDNAYSDALKRLDGIISDNGYDYELSMAHINDLSQKKKNQDICYILAVYSVTSNGAYVSRNDLKNKLDTLEGDIYEITYEEQQTTCTIDGQETIVSYADFTIHNVSKNKINEAFGVEPDVIYENNGNTYGEMINFYTYSIANMINGKE